MRKLKLFFTCLLMASISLVNAQTKTASGTVLSTEDGLPVIGASVMVKGTSQGTVTDVQGRYSLNVPTSANTLVISLVGMRTVEVSATSNLRVEMEPAVSELEELLVVGYGVQRREAKTGSITQVTADKMADIPASSFDKMLTGKMAGVSVTSQSGQPGASTSIRIRGTSSINAGNEPLYVVDGVPVMSGEQTNFTNTSNALALINPNDIEAVTVLKDAAAASIYGSRAANGVVLITTKSGREGKTRVTLRAKTGVSSLANDNGFGILNPRELVDYMRDAVINAGIDPDSPIRTNAQGVQEQNKYYTPYELLTRPQTNWMKALTRLGKMREFELNTASGGGGKTNYYGSASFHKNDGIFYGVGFDKFQVRANVDHDINKYLKTGTRVNAGYMYGQDIPMQSLYYSNPMFAGQLILPWTPLRNADGTINASIPENNNTNPLATAEYDDQWEKQYKLNGNIYLEVKPIKELTFKTTNSADVMSGEGRRYWNPLAHPGQKNADGSVYGTLQTTTTLERLLTTSNTLTYDNMFEEHAFRALIGQEANIRDGYYYYNYSPKVDPDMPYANTGVSADDQIEYGFGESTLLSYFGILDYNYAGKYYFQGSVRRDGSSLFGQNRRWGTFYSIGLSWNLHNESFMKELSMIDMLKLRLSYGVNGNNAIGRYRQFGLYSSTQYNGVIGMAPSNPANPDLAWEKNTAYNAGIDFRFLKRFSGSFDVYTRMTSDMLLDRPLSSTSGFTSMQQNIGKVRNNGFELQLDANILEGDVKWDMGLNLSHNRSKIVDLGGEEKLAYAADGRLQHVVGRQLYSFYLFDYAGVNPANGLALWRTKDGDLTTNYGDANRIYTGSPEPDYFGGISSTLSYMGFQFSILGEYKLGNEVFILENRYINSDGASWNTNQANTAKNYWKKPGDTGVGPKPIADNATNSNSFTSTRWLQRGDYFRIKDVTLSYMLPTSLVQKAKLSGVKVYASGYNAFTFHKVNFWDPERGIDGLGAGIYPMTKTFVIGVDVTF